MSKPIKITGLTPGWNFHIHAAELDAETVVDENGEVSFSVANGFSAVMPHAVTWKDPNPENPDEPSGEGGAAQFSGLNSGVSSFNEQNW